MLRIGITQRVDQHADRAERRDCLDQAWTPLLRQIDCISIPIANGIEDVSLLIEALDIEGILLTGGNDVATLAGATNVAPERDATEKHLLEIAAERDIPVFGVCRGLQIMAHHYGSKLSRVTEHVATRHAIEVWENQRVRLTDRDAVNSFHDFGVRSKHLSPNLIPLAAAPDGTVEAIVHRSRRQAAVMWHPERDPHDSRDREMIRSFFNASEH